MSLPCITIPSVEVPHFEGMNFVSWKSQMFSYLRKMNPQVWWMLDVCLSYALEDCPQTQGQKKWLYLEAHASNALSSAFNAEIKDAIKIEYGLLKRATLLWKTLEQMFDSSNDKRSSSTNIPENVSSSSIHIDQDQEEQSSILSVWENLTVWFSKSEYPVLAGQKLPWLKKKIAPRQVLTTTMMMMTLMMNMIMKSPY
jgi:hypothetical protein